MKLRFASIISRIVWLHVFALAGIAVAVSSAAYLLLNSSVNDFEERILHDHADAIRQHLRVAGEGWHLDLPPDLQATYSRGYGGFALSVADADGHPVFSSLSDGHLLFPLNLREKPSFSQEMRNGVAFYGVSMPVEDGGRRAWIQVAQNLEDPDVIVDDVASNFLKRIAFVVVPIFGLLFVLDAIIIRRALAPIRAASETAAAIQPSKIDVRLPIGELPSEIQPLAKAINDALDRLEQAFTLQREFVADAAHELRTPLTILRTQVDLLRDRAAAAALLTDIESMTRIIDQLLDLAELEILSGSGDAHTELNQLCAEVVSAMAPLALAQKRTIGFSRAPNPVWVHGDSDMIYRAVRNLVDNAIRHTRVDTSVDVSVAADGAAQVSDNGDGIPPQRLELIFQRFWRADRRTKNHSGLGLSIVAQVARVTGATIAVHNRPDGGAVFTLHFRKAVAAQNMPLLSARPFLEGHENTDSPGFHTNEPARP